MNQNLSSWDLVKTFLLVMREGSLSAAARAMAVSQPTIRRQIEALEADLKAALFTRTRGGLLPTAAGQALVADAEAAEAAMGAVLRGASGQSAGDSGTVRLACSEVFAVEIVPGLLASLMQAHPGLVVETVMSNQVADLLRRDADVAIRLTAPRQQALVARKVAPIELGLYATRDFLKRHRPPPDYDAFARSGRFISEDRRDYQRRSFAAMGRAFPEQLVYRSDSDLAQLAALRAGLGIGICQQAIAARDELVRVLPGVSARLECWVVMHEELRKVERVRLVFDHLVAALGARHPLKGR